MHLARGVAGVAVVGLLGACGGSAQRSDGVVVEQPRIGARPSGADAALYLDLTSPVDDRLVGATVPSDVAAATSLHMTVPVEGGGEVMTEVAAFELAAGQVVRLEPFGDHLMVEDLRLDLAPGAEVAVTLRFERQPPLDVVAEVRQLFDLVWEDA